MTILMTITFICAIASGLYSRSQGGALMQRDSYLNGQRIGMIAAAVGLIIALGCAITLLKQGFHTEAGSFDGTAVMYFLLNLAAIAWLSRSVWQTIQNSMGMVSTDFKRAMIEDVAGVLHKKFSTNLADCKARIAGLIDGTAAVSWPEGLDRVEIQVRRVRPDVYHRILKVTFIDGVDADFQVEDVTRIYSETSLPLEINNLFRSRPGSEMVEKIILKMP